MRTLTVFTLIAGPLGSLAATGLWTEGRYGATGGMVLVLAMVLWSFGLVGLLEYARPVMPRLAPAMLLVLLFGTMGGMAFGFQGFFEAVFGASKESSLAALEAHPLETTVLLWTAGPLMPSGLLVLAVLLAWRRLVPLWTAGLLAAGAVAFPLSRIPRIDLVAYLADALLVAAFVAIAALVATGRLDRAVATASRPAT